MWYRTGPGAALPSAQGWISATRSGCAHAGLLNSPIGAFSLDLMRAPHASQLVRASPTEYLPIWPLAARFFRRLACGVSETTPLFDRPPCSTIESELEISLTNRWIIVRALLSTSAPAG